MRRSSTIIAAALVWAAPAAFAQGWTQSYDAGHGDANGAWAGGSEIMHLVPHKGKLYAANGYWEDERWKGVPHDDRQSAQVLRLDGPAAAWQVDLDMGVVNDINARYMKGNILKSLTFAVDGEGRPLSPPRNLLVMASGNLTSHVSSWVRDDATDEWTHQLVKSGTPEKGVRWVPRDVEVYRDKISGIEHIFMVLGNPGIISGVYDASQPTSIRWDDDIEFPTTGAFSTRPLGITQANGKLYFSVGGVIYERQDGPEPTYHEVVNLGDGVNTEIGGVRGLTPIANPNGEGESILFMWTPNSRSAGCMKRLDPDGKGGYVLHQEACLGPLMGEALGVETVYTLGAYSNIVPVTDPKSGETVRLIGFQTKIKGSQQSTWNGYYQGAMYAIRTSGQEYRLAEVNDRYKAGKPTLVAPRTFVMSPFPADKGMLYVAGHDSNFQISSDMAWIFRAPIADVLREQTY